MAANVIDMMNPFVFNCLYNTTALSVYWLAIFALSSCCWWSKFILQWTLCVNFGCNLMETEQWVNRMSCMWYHVTQMCSQPMPSCTILSVNFEGSTASCGEKSGTGMWENRIDSLSVVYLFRHWIEYTSVVGWNEMCFPHRGPTKCCFFSPSYCGWWQETTHHKKMPFHAFILKCHWR